MATLYPPIALFKSDSTTPLQLGVDALLYVMENGHTASVPLQALYFAEKVAITTIAPREVCPIMLAKVNAAINTIARSIRNREAIERVDAAALASLPADTPNEGPMAKLQPAPIVRPPAPVALSLDKVDIPF